MTVNPLGGQIDVIEDTGFIVKGLGLPTPVQDLQNCICLPESTIADVRSLLREEKRTIADLRSFIEQLRAKATEDISLMRDQNSTIASLDAIIYEQSKEIDKLTSENNHANERIDNLCEALKNLIDTN